MMFKKLVIASAVLAATTSVAFAHANYKGDYKSEAVAACPAYNPAVAPYVGVSLASRLNYASNAKSFNGLPIALFAGYGGIVSPNIYLAGEIFADYSINLVNYASSGHSLKSTWDYGLSVIPGYMVTDHLLAFLRLGAIETRFSDQSTNKTGWQAGLGGQVNLYQNWDLRAEWTYTGYSSIRGVGAPHSQQATLGFVYRIA